MCSFGEENLYTGTAFLLRRAASYVNKNRYSPLGLHHIPPHVSEKGIFFCTFCEIFLTIEFGFLFLHRVHQTQRIPCLNRNTKYGVAGRLNAVCAQMKCCVALTVASSDKRSQQSAAR